MRLSILSAIGCSIVVVLLSAATSRNTNAEPNQRPPMPVLVVNTPEEPITVATEAPLSISTDEPLPISIDEPLIIEDDRAKNRFQMTRSDGWDESNGLFYVELTTVPEGKVLVIEHISMYANIGFAEELHWPRLNFGSFDHHYLDFKRTTPDLAYSMTGSQPFLGRWHGSQQTRLYATGTVSFQCNRANTPFVDGAAGITLSGYFTDAE